MMYWYDNLLVHIKWGGLLGGSVRVKCGTRQGGLASPWIFNLFYKDLINMLSESNNGVTINQTEVSLMFDIGYSHVEYLPNVCRISDNYVRHFLCQLNICRMSVEYQPNVCRMSLEYLTTM